MGRYLDIIEEYGMSSNAQGSAVRRRKAAADREREQDDEEC